MTNASRKWIVFFTILLVLSLIAVSFLFGYKTGEDNYKRNIDSIPVDTITVIERDSTPVLVSEVVIETVPEPFPVYITEKGDTVREKVYVEVPITQKRFSGDLYDIYVSGYKQRLDSVNVYTKYIYVDRVPQERKWGVGLGAGVGVGRAGVTPFVGIVGYYKIF